MRRSSFTIHTMLPTTYDPDAVARAFLTDLKEFNMAVDLSTVHPSQREILEWFETAHLPESLKPAVEKLRDAALWSVEHGSGAELTVGLRKLLEAKDAIVRSVIHKQKTEKKSG